MPETCDKKHPQAVECLMICPMDCGMTGGTLAKIASALYDWKVSFDDRGGIGFELMEDDA